ncbi:transposase [Pseudoalteromonas sp. NEC-BIFX-2020_015]|uniref:transposase n=1 Tax=Pseudoalteromonas sp. NEC-BIFX-2020_015 TaxID=2729544 RepID=UPI0014615A9A|nr:transposase [Pseudoalteromonas sp. NEC-BIFX-2020_015]NMR24832.1 transposase [Pseudoalteromonas sp. NEC-BIFX-2020_015]
MAIARKRQISLVDTKYYHCISRCVRRAFLCGEDCFTGKSYEHRRGWVEEKLLSLAKVFCIDVCAYAVMSNHTHLVLYVDDKKAKRLNDKAIVIRWHKLCKGTVLKQRYIQSEKLSKAELIFFNQTVKQYRERLASISWFMRLLNEDITRKANKEDNCTGLFWEGRFKSQALLDEASLAACMAYVDLNPIRARMANTPEESSHTSVQKRLESAKDGKQPKHLMRFAGMSRQHMPKGLPFELKSYLDLVELTGRCIREDKRGYIDNTHSRLLERANISADNWLKLTTHFTRVFDGAVGRPTSQEGYCEDLNRKRRANVSNCEKLLA